MRCYARDPQNHAWISYNARFAITRFGILPANLCFVNHQNQLIDAKVDFKHDVPCIVRSETLKGNAPRALTDPRGPFVPRSA